MSNTTNVNEMLEGRASRYGSFEGHAKISQALKAVMHERSGWDRLKPKNRIFLTTPPDTHPQPRYNPLKP